MPSLDSGENSLLFSRMAFRLHGHNYEVEVILQAAALDGVGFVKDYRELAALKEFLDAAVDHNHLNDVLVRRFALQCTER